jgi:putative RecB family exonuclease
VTQPVTQSAPQQAVPPRMVTAYPSRLVTFTDCPRRYRFHYLDRPTPARRGAWAHTTFGAAVHLALARWWDMPTEQRTPAQVADEVSAGWSHEGFADEAMSRRWLAKARAMVATYVAVETDRRRVLAHAGLVEPRRVESSVVLRAAGDVALMGRPDRIDERPGAAGTELVVVDYKTGRAVPSADDARTSRTLAIYAAAAQATLHRPATRVELHHVPSGTVAVWRHDEASRDRHVSRAVAVARECRTSETALAEGGSAEQLFPPRPGPLCPWCDYRDSCAEGIEAGPAVEPWAGLEPGATAPQADGLRG